MFTSSPSITSTTSTQPANIHIDRFRVTGPCTHSVLGGGQWEYIDFNSGEIRHAGNGLNGKLDHPDSQFYVRSRSVRAGMAGQLEIHVCPPKLLQRHNVFGHGNLHDYVCRIFDLLTHRYDITVDPRERQYWLDGLYWLTEVHLTANFACQRDLLQPIIDAVDQHHGKGKHRNGDQRNQPGLYPANAAAPTTCSPSTTSTRSSSNTGASPARCNSAFWPTSAMRCGWNSSCTRKG